MVIGRGLSWAGSVRCWTRPARGHSAAMLLEGEAGVGKSTLLAAAAELEDGGTTVLRARGVESEAGLDHAALLELLGAGARPAAGPAAAPCRRVRRRAGLGRRRRDRATATWSAPAR